MISLVKIEIKISIRVDTSTIDYLEETCLHQRELKRVKDRISEYESMKIKD